MLERAGGRRQNENADQVGARCLAQLLRALPIDIKQNIASRLQSLRDRPSRRAVAMPKHFRPFEQLALSDHVVEASAIDKMIVATVDLAAAFRPRRHRYRKYDLAIGSQQQTRQGGFSRA